MIYEFWFKAILYTAIDILVMSAKWRFLKAKIECFLLVDFIIRFFLLVWQPVSEISAMAFLNESPSYLNVINTRNRNIFSDVRCTQSER